MTPSSKASWAASVPSGSSPCRRRRGLRRRAGRAIAAGCGLLRRGPDLPGRRPRRMRRRRSTPGKDPPLDVGEIPLTQGEQALPSRSGRAEGRSDDFGDEAVPGCVDGRQLELSGAEQGVDAAFGQAGRPGEPADGQALQAVDRGQLRCLPDDPGPGALSWCPGPPGLALVLVGHRLVPLLPALDLRRTIVYKYLYDRPSRKAAMPPAGSMPSPGTGGEADRRAKWARAVGPVRSAVPRASGAD